jgi:3-deoxy-7-phosphoheptulonate synthase
MSFKKMNKIPSPEEIIDLMPMPNDLKAIKISQDEKIKNIFTGNDDKLAIIIGPCSADNEDAMCEYVEKCASVQEKVEDTLIIIPRIYTNKPRTSGTGYKGMLHQPDPTENPNIVEGIKAIRKMHLRSISVSHLTAADEMLYPNNYPYLEDVLSYVAIGARSVENQQHRLTVSGLDIPIGMKNPTSGDIEVMLNSIQAAQHSHVFVYNEWEVETTGNPFAHAVLRGSMNFNGQHHPNYHYEDLIRVFSAYEKRDLANPGIIIDTNHSNSAKQFKEQPRIAKDVLTNCKFDSALKSIIKGFMIESYLIEGAQDNKGNVYGRSITDPCLGWEDSYRLIMDIAEYV